jgi:hypothetical protein
MKKLALICVLPLLGACSTIGDVTDGFFNISMKEVPPVPYTFTISSFLDFRPQEQELRLEDALNPRTSHAFEQNTFLTHLVSDLNGRQPYDYENATLRVELRDYAAFKEAMKYTVSTYVDITAVGEDGKVITTGVFSCLERLSSVTDYVRELTVPEERNQDMTGKTILGKVRIWDKLNKQCANDIAYQFNTKVNEWERRRK